MQYFPQGHGGAWFEFQLDILISRQHVNVIIFHSKKTSKPTRKGNPWLLSLDSKAFILLKITQHSWAEFTIGITPLLKVWYDNETTFRWYGSPFYTNNRLLSGSYFRAGFYFYYDTTDTAIDLLVRSDLIHSLQHNFKHLSQHHSFTVVVDKLIEVFFLTSEFPFLKLLILRNMKHKQTQPYSQQT